MPIIPVELTGGCHNYCNAIVVEVFGATLGAGWINGGKPYDAELTFWKKGDNNVTVKGPYCNSNIANELNISCDSNATLSNTNISVIPNKPAKSLYTIEVWTGDEADAGTDSPIAITLYDENNNSSG